MLTAVPVPVYLYFTSSAKTNVFSSNHVKQEHSKSKVLIVNLLNIYVSFSAIIESFPVFFVFFFD